MDHSKNIYLVQGLFYQDIVTYGIGQKPGIGEAVYQTTNLHHVLFSGVIAPKPDNLNGPLAGVLHDHFGDSSLSEVTFTDEKLEFIKEYDKSGTAVNYVFDRKDGDIWIGAWTSRRAGTGFAKCLITEVHKDFFDPTSAAKLLGITLSTAGSDDDDLQF